MFIKYNCYNVLSGYAWSGGGRKIIRIDVTNDKGEKNKKMRVKSI